jgi:hypothetical protein
LINLKKQDHIHQVNGKPKDMWWSDKQRQATDAARMEQVKQKVMMMMIQNLSGKDNRKLILKGFLLAWSRIAQFEHIRNKGTVLGAIHPGPGKDNFAAFACDAYDVKEDPKRGRCIMHVVSEPRFVIQRPLGIEGRQRSVGGMVKFEPESLLEARRKRVVIEEEPYWMGYVNPKPCKELLEVTCDEIDDIINPAYRKRRQAAHDDRDARRAAALQTGM